MLQAFLFLPATLAFAAYAPTAATSQWKMADETDSYLQAPACRAFTQTSNSAEPLELSMSYPKDGKTLPMVSLRTKLAPPAIAVKISASEAEPLLLLQAGATNQDANLFWYAPVNFPRFESIVRDRDFLDLVLDPRGAKTPVRLSLAGSSNALDQVKKCLQAVSFPAAFFTELNGQKENLTPDLGDRTPLFLFRTVQQAFDAWNVGRGIQAELAKLRAANKPLLEQEAAALASRNAAAANFTAAKAKLEGAQAREAELSTQLKAAKEDLAKLQAEKPLAEADFAQKKASFEGAKAQADAQKSVNDLTAEISRNEALITKNTKRIPELESEKARLVRAIPGLEDDVARARRRYNDADYTYRQYDVRREAQKILDRDFSYSGAKRDRDNAKRSRDQAQSKYWSANSNMNSAKGALDSCRRTPNANCSSQQSAFDQAQREWQQAFREVNDWDYKIRSYESKIRDLESDAERKARNESDRLRSIADDESRRLSRARGELNAAQDRVAEIRNAIPVLRKQIETAEAALPGLRDRLTAAQSLLTQKTEERARFAEQIGYAGTEQAYQAAVQRLKSVNDGIAARSKEIPVLTKNLADVQKLLPGLAKAFQSADAALQAAEAKLAPIQEKLKPFRAAESEKAAALDAEQAKFRNARAAYQDLLRELRS